VDLSGFPTEYKQGALATREALNILRKETILEWSFLSPSAHLSPGRRTGQFRLGTDQLLTNAQGESRISVEDYAMAMIVEVEKPKHICRRFTVGYWVGMIEPISAIAALLSHVGTIEKRVRSISTVPQ
jgi:putative NADH-flavin reductase